MNDISKEGQGRWEIEKREATGAEFCNWLPVVHDKLICRICNCSSSSSSSTSAYLSEMQIIGRHQTRLIILGVVLHHSFFVKVGCWKPILKIYSGLNFVRHLDRSTYFVNIFPVERSLATIPPVIDGGDSGQRF